MKLKYRLLFILLIFGLFFLLKSWHCAVLEFSEISPKLTNQNKTHYNEIAFLFGGGLCSSCPPGRFLSNLRERPNCLLVVPEEFSEEDIGNLKDVFGIKSLIIKGDHSILQFSKKIAACQKLDTWERNILINLDKNKKIRSIKIIQ